MTVTIWLSRIAVLNNAGPMPRTTRSMPRDFGATNAVEPVAHAWANPGTCFVGGGGCFQRLIPTAPPTSVAGLRTRGAHRPMVVAAAGATRRRARVEPRRPVCRIGPMKRHYFRPVSRLSQLTADAARIAGADAAIVLTEAVGSSKCLAEVPGNPRPLADDRLRPRSASRVANSPDARNRPISAAPRRSLS